MTTLLLNYFPPSDIFKPSISLSVLKSYLLSKNIKVEVVYWNVLLHDLFREHFGDKANDLGLCFVLFSYLLNKDKYHNDLLNTVITTKTQKLTHIDFKLFEEKLNKIIIQTIISKTSDDEDIIYGISTKFYQWLPGLYFTKIIKNSGINISTLLGSMKNKESAIDFMNLFDPFDFAIWGEGEVPLFELYLEMNNKTNAFDKVSRLAYRKDNHIVINDFISDNKDIEFLYSPNYDDYFKHLDFINKYRHLISIPMELSRGCEWARCKFCSLNDGYTYKEKNNHVFIKELIENISKYNIFKFHLTDNSFGKINNKDFDMLLCVLQELNTILCSN